LTHVLEFLVRHGYGVLFAWVLAEMLGAPVPSVPMLLAMGALIGTDNYSFALAITLILTATLLADSAWYFLGRKKGPAVLKLLCRISLEPDSCVSNTRSWFTKMGAWALLLSKFVPGLGAVASPMAGLSRMPFWKFLSADVAGSALWGGAYLGTGFLFRTQLEDVAQIAFRLGGSVIAIVIGAAILWIGWKYWQRRRFIKSLRVARITPEEVFERLAEMVVVDLRSATEVELDGTRIPGALWFDVKELEANQHLIPADRDVVLYCT
jgi:membrane protein DedA with SNARE-associated domain